MHTVVDSVQPYSSAAEELIKLIKSYSVTVNEEKLKHACQFCYEAHLQQTRASGEPFFFHPLEVSRILASMHLDEATIIGGILHDTVEDTPITLPHIQEKFGREVARLIDGVTKLSRIEKQAKKITQAENLRKLILAMSEDIRVLLIKLADRLHNMRTLSHIKDHAKRNHIARETLDIYVLLAERIGVQKIKDELANLAFKELNPEAYQSITTLFDYRVSKEPNIIPHISHNLQKTLEQKGLKDVTVTGRSKTKYSIWCKLRNKQLNFTQLEDLMAFRVLLETNEQCYTALGILHACYTPIPDRFKDYIGIPKPNGYQSLHTCIIGPYSERLEVQIRTKNMHEICENGVAAHWAYKQNKQAEHQKEYRKWLKILRDIAENTQKPEEFLEHTKLELYHDEVFCYTPKGNVIALPRGATPIDFAYAVHSEIGNHCTGATVNGTMQPLRKILNNGDIVEIFCSPNQKPSPDWEKIVVTGRAKAHIRRFLRLQNRPQYIQLGKQLLQKALRQEGIEFSEKTLEKTLLDAVEEKLHVQDIDDLFYGVGRGLYKTLEIAHMVAALQPVEVDKPSDSLDENIPVIKPSPPQKQKSSNPLIIEGLIPGMAIHYAKCCSPLVGDPIRGIITTGKGVTIHMANCETLDAFDHTPERFIDVAWQWQEGGNHKDDALLTGRLHVILANKKNYVSTLSTAIEKNNGHIKNVKIISRTPDFIELFFDIHVRDTQHMQHIIAVLRAIPMVSEVQRHQGH